ncbi:MAG: hypothetical protein COT74_00935 [Bdellovibrionales bacterium CG10_big_fil_rev_8_21_14_0_10_45_34]|nr:MAG: hypothetical protein COT74_00935 [Bdellovibrionales bacterium CG10_big_fil_rev_8_21_14_0_10_45_34]
MKLILQTPISKALFVLASSFVFANTNAVDEFDPKDQVKIQDIGGLRLAYSQARQTIDRSTAKASEHLRKLCGSKDIVSFEQCKGGEYAKSKAAVEEFKKDISIIQEHCFEDSQYKTYVCRNSPKFVEITGRKGYLNQMAWQNKKSDLEKTLADKEAEAKKLEDEFNKALSSLNSADERLTLAQNALLEKTKKSQEEDIRRAEMTALQEQMTRMRETVRGNNFARTLDSVSDGITDLNTKLRVLSEEYDNTLMGAYMYEKMNRLLKSKDFCDAQKYCEKDQANENDYELKTVFEPTKTSYQKNKTSNRRGAQ